MSRNQRSAVGFLSLRPGACQLSLFTLAAFGVLLPGPPAGAMGGGGSSGADYHGRHLPEFTGSSSLRYSDFADATLDAVSLTLPAQGWANSNLRGLRVGSGTLTGGSSVFSKADATRAVFENLTLTIGAGGFSLADFTDAAFHGCRLTGAADSWAAARLTGTTFRACDLSAAGNLALAVFSRPPRYDTQTVLPLGFDPAAAGWLLLTPGPVEVEIISLRGEAAAGLPGLTHLSYPSGAVGAPGRVAFLGTLAGSGVTTANETSLWRELSGAGPSLIAREGSPANEADPRTNFRTFKDIRFQPDGAVTFETLLQGAGVTANNDRALWHQAPDEAALTGSNALIQLAREQMPFEGIPGTFLRTFSAAAYSASQSALQGSFVVGQGGIVAGSDTFIAWQRTRPDNAVTGSNAWRLVAREGTPVNAPGLAANVAYSTLRPRVSLDYGTLAYSAILKNVPATQNTALFQHQPLLGPTGNLRAPTARVGPTLVVGFSADAYRRLFGG